jgi:hypothetical protein
MREPRPGGHARGTPAEPPTIAQSIAIQQRNGNTLPLTTHREKTFELPAAIRIMTA